MDEIRFDKIGTYFASKRRSRRQAIQQGVTGLAAAGLAATGLNAVAAQDATPAAGGEGTLSSSEFLFVQSFESGSIAPKDGAEGTYTVTLQHGLGQTLYFSDRPERIVGAAPTPQFLDGLGFSPDNPPNAALVIGSDDGGTDIAVVELTNPTYDEASSTATYDVSVLENFASDVDMQLQADPVDLATVASSFGSAHLFIDDCPDQVPYCYDGTDAVRGTLPQAGTCWSWSTFSCHFCDQGTLNSQCNAQFPDCGGACGANVGGI
jgi:hypothetical protein